MSQLSVGNSDEAVNEDQRYFCEGVYQELWHAIVNLTFADLDSSLSDSIIKPREDLYRGCVPQPYPSEGNSVKKINEKKENISDWGCRFHR